MGNEEEAKRKRILAQVYEILLLAEERGKHTIYDENLSWEENKYVMRQRWKSSEFPETLTWTERKIFSEVMKEINAEHQREELKRRERLRRVKKNLLNYHFFWERLKPLWLHLRADERLHILQLLQDVEWNDRIIAEIRQILDNAQLFAALTAKTSVAQEPQQVMSEELRLIVDLSDDTLWDDLIALYLQGPPRSTRA